MRETKVKLFEAGNSQAVRLPKGFDFVGGGEVFLQRDETTGDVLISQRPGSGAWTGFFGLVRTIEESPPYRIDRPLNQPMAGAAIAGEAA